MEAARPRARASEVFPSVTEFGNVRNIPIPYDYGCLEQCLQKSTTVRL